MRKIMAILVLAGLIAALPASAAEEGRRPGIVDVLTARLATAATPEDAAETAEALRELYGQSESPSAEVLYSQSEVLAGEGDTQNTLYKLTRALVLDDHLVGALVLRGDVRLENGNVEEAYEDAMNAVRLAPDYYAGLGLLARTFEAQGRYASALATTRQALEYYPLSEELQEQLHHHEALAAGGAAGL